MNLGGLAGLSGAYGGYQEAENQDLRNRLLRVQGSKGQYDLDTQQGADAALAKALPNILGGVPGVAGLAGFGGLQGGPPQQGTQIAPQQQGPLSAAPMPPAQASVVPSGLPPSPYGQQPGLGFSGGAGVGDRGGFGLQRPGFPQVQQDLGDPSAQNRAMYGPLADAAGQRAQALGQPNMAAIPPQQPFAPRPQPAPPPQQMPFTPQQQPQGMPQGQPMGGVQPPQMMDWRGAFQSIVKSNPGAPPGAVIGAMDKLVQLMNPIERAQWMEQRNMLNMMLGLGKLKLGGEQLEERKSEFNRREAAGGLGPRSAISQYLQQYRTEHPSADAEEIKRAAQGYHSEQVAMSRFFSGDRSKTIAALDNVVGHLGTLKKLGEAWAAGDIQTFNALGAEWVAQTGGAAPTNIQTAGAIVGPEVLKALNVAQAGTGEERQQIKNIFDTAKSAEQFNQAIDVARKLLSRQFRTQRRQFQVATGLPADKFDAMLSPDVRPYLDEEEGAAPLKQSGGFSVGAPVK